MWDSCQKNEKSCTDAKEQYCSQFLKTILQQKGLEGKIIDENQEESSEEIKHQQEEGNKEEESLPEKQKIGANIKSKESPFSFKKEEDQFSC